MHKLWCSKNKDNGLRKIKYKEWALIFATLEHPYLNSSEALTLAQDVIKENPNSNIANTILALFY